MPVESFDEGLEKKENYYVFSGYAGAPTVDFTTHLHCVSGIYLTPDS